MNALIGGMLIGVAASLLWLLSGRIAGVSGVLGRVVVPADEPGDNPHWRYAFLLGLPLGAACCAWLYLPPINIDTAPATLIGAGLLVGVGTQVGSGCTSGHGVCGLARFSPRSLVATCTFMLVAAITVWATNS